MDTIFANIKDPSWWFSAVFIAIIASVIAGFVKDKVEKWLATVFASLRQKQIEHEENRAKIINTLLEDNVYLSFALFRVLLSAIAFTYLLVIYYSPALSTSHFVQVLPSDIEGISSNKIGEAFRFILGLLNMILGYRMSRRASIALDAAVEYRKRNNLPRFR